MSKELTPLEALADLRIDAGHHLDDHVEYLNKRLDIIEKSLKALEIIINRRVNLLEVSVSGSYETYMSFFEKWNLYGEYDKYVLTKEEFELLKEVLL